MPKRRRKPTIADAERLSLRTMLTLFAISRAIENEADARYGAAAENIRHIAATLDQISDEVLLRLSSVNIQSEGLLSELIAARMAAVGFQLPLCADAADFIAPIDAVARKVLADAKPHTH